MDDRPSEPLAPEAELALAYTQPIMRGPLTIFLEFDSRLARIVSKTTEPILGQMRLAWWRDNLAKLSADRPRGDAVLDGIGEHWAGREAALVPVVDAWEVLVAEEELSAETITQFGAGRAKPFTALDPAIARGESERAMTAGMRWALADAAARISGEVERQQFCAVGASLSSPDVPLPNTLRGLAVLEALALRALRRGGRPLMEGRTASLIALRAAFFGR